MFQSSPKDAACTRALVALVAFLGIATSLAHATDTRLAKVAAIQNVVETKRAATDSWSPSTQGQALVAGDRIRTGAASRAAVQYSDQTLQRINEKSEVEILAPAAGGSGVVKILSGQSFFTARTPKDFGRVQTRTVTAAIKGTEFAVGVAEDGTTVVTMIEGTVEASNEFGSVTVGAGEEAVAEPGKAPQRRIAVRPRDAVAWSLYYPPVLGGSDAERLAAAGPSGERLIRAASALSNGQIGETVRLLDEARAADSRNPVALALSSVVALAADRKDEARTFADAALAADANSPSALLARSFVAQADFDLLRARDLAEKAATADPRSAEALARAAELRLAMGDHRGALEAATAAVDRQPNNARALSVLGFVDLAAYRTDAAAAGFDRSVSADGGFPMARAGRGIAQIRLGNVAAGREEIQTAATLDPGESLYRSYLGKAYYEEKRATEAGKELAAAKDLDPNDPTPWLYSALLLQNENRPIEAMRDLNSAIDKNGNRAVYRSRLLLDEDRAVRGTDLARIYADLGFDALGLVAARRSADENQANFSSHLFLAGNYRNLPGFASSFLSETLQARIYQPVGANAARPESQGGAVAFNEYTALFDRPRASRFASASYAMTDTDIDAYFGDCGSPCSDFFGLRDSDGWSGSLMETYNGDRVSASLGVRRSRDDGFRKNSGQENSVYTGFVQYAASDRDTVQINAIIGNRETGDLPLRQIPLIIAPTTFDTDQWNIGVGWHRRFSPALDLAVSGIWNKTEQRANLLDFDLAPTGISSRAQLDGPQIEGQVVYRQSPRLTWVMGAGAFDGSFEAQAAAGPRYRGDESFSNAYGYLKVRGLGPVELTAGAAVENVDYPVGLLPPRDSRTPLSDLTFDDTRFSPKFGATATFGSGTTLRASIFSRLAAGIGRLQSLEPTQVSGFNQFYEDVGGTRSWNYGIGIDQQIGKTVFLGASWLERDSDVPEVSCSNPSPFSNCNDPATAGTPLLVDRESDDAFAAAYVNVLIGPRVAASLDWNLDRRDFETTTFSPIGSFQDFMKTNRYRPQVRVFLPVGFFTSVAGSYYSQRVDQFEDQTSPERRAVIARFWTLDASIGWRLPKRLGSISVEATNLTDHEFEFYEQSLQENVIPARRVVVRADFAF